MKEKFIKWYGLDLGKNKPGVGQNALGWFRILIPGQKIFFTPALYHDLEYTLGGNELDKNKADLKFYKLCLDNSKTKFHKKLAGFYFYSLKMFGLFYFELQQTYLLINYFLNNKIYGN